MNQHTTISGKTALQTAEVLFDTFRKEIAEDLAAGRLADGIIGKDLMIDGPFGPQRMIYADYAASGRALRQVENFVLEHVLPVYANPHTQASYCGRAINALRKVARREIAKYCGAGPDYAVIFAGTGATCGINRLVNLFGLNRSHPEGERPLVVIGPYEHHSNLLPWRECGAELVELAEAATGGPDLNALEAIFTRSAGRKVTCSFSAGSNVTGALTDVEAVTRMANRHGARIIWDYAGAGPYLPIAMRPGQGAQIDALVLSPHKFVGGPGSSGVMIVRRDAVEIETPSLPGGGTVSFVSPDTHDYSKDIQAREEAGTPNAIADIRAALAIIVRDCMARADLDRHSDQLARRALDAWRANPRLELLGADHDAVLPIISFRIQDGQGRQVHHQLFTRLLSDRYGVQARGGCACAGPYVHRLLDITPAESEAMRQAILSGKELEKPGFVRVNFSALMDDDDATWVIDAVNQLSDEIESLAPCYCGDSATAIFNPV